MIRSRTASCVSRLGENLITYFMCVSQQNKFDQKLETYVMFLCECWRFKKVFISIFFASHFVAELMRVIQL